MSSRAVQAAATDSRRRYAALFVLCLGVLMIVLDATIVNVALPSIQEDLRFPDSSLVWVMNAYMLTYGGSLLLGGRLGDVYGARRVYLLGIAFFTLASLACGLANTPGVLILRRWCCRRGSGVVTRHEPLH
jgi:MFS family permease